MVTRNPSLHADSEPKNVVEHIVVIGVAESDRYYLSSISLAKSAVLPSSSSPSLAPSPSFSLPIVVVHDAAIARKN